MKTLSYPNYSEFIPSGPQYDLGKWMNAMKDIYVKVHLGADKNAAIEQIVNDWDKMEKISFLDWMKYYGSGDQNKYKKAQHSYYVNDDINFFIPNPQKIPSPIRNVNEQIANIPQQAAQVVEQKPVGISEEDKRKLIEDQRRKILGRLNSAEKLLSAHQGQIFAGPDFERLLSAIYELKKQIQTVNKITISAQTCVDLIVRQANILKRQGFSDASEFMVKLAQNTPGNFNMNLGDTPAGGSQPQGQGALGNNDLSLGDAAATPPAAAMDAPADENDPLSGGMPGFMANLEGSGITIFNEGKIEKEEKEDKNKVEDEVDLGDEDDVLLDQEILPEDEDGLVVKEAQMATQVPAEKRQAPMQDASPEAESPAPQPDLEAELPEKSVSQDVETEPAAPQDIKAEQAAEAKSNIDSLIDSAFANITIADVIDKLEDINKIFRTREIGRQLAIVDVMLGRLGLAPYFPMLGEATTKQLEANQYCLTRLEDILSKLRGTQPTGQIDLTSDNTPPAAEQAKQSLEQGEQKDKAKKDMKKQIEDNSMMAKLKPSPEVESAPEDLAAQPSTLEAPVQAPIPQPQARPTTQQPAI